MPDPTLHTTAGIKRSQAGVGLRVSLEGRKREHKAAILKDREHTEGNHNEHKKRYEVREL